MSSRMPSAEAIARARAEIEAENRAASQPDPLAAYRPRQQSLPSEHPDHTCDMYCDGQDGWNSDCARIRRKLFGGGR